MIVMKFGGTLMGSTEAIRHSASLVVASIRGGEQVVVVPSAMSGVTDQLLKIATSAEQGEIAFSNDEISLIRERHLLTAKELGANEGADERTGTHKKLEELFESLSQTVHGIYLLKELSKRSKDLIVSFGERLSAPLMSAALTALGIKAHDLTGGQAGLVTNTNFGNARPLPEAFARIPARLEELFKDGITPVVTGFIGETEKGAITTLGRGGTDYTATILGAALGAREVWAWKDVDGVMTTDPRIVPEAQNLEQLSYLEIMEMAYFGAKVLHPLAVTPLQEKNIPLRVKSAADPSFAGTLVTSESRPLKNVVKAVTAIRNACIIDIGGAGMVGAADVVAQIFDVLAEKEVNVVMISQSSSMANISLVVQQADGHRALEALQKQFLDSEIVRTIEFWEAISVVAIVGEGMRGARGVAAKLFAAVAGEDVSIDMISQGSSELNISFAIDDEHTVKTVRAIHKAFGLEKLEMDDA
jgi:aspartate kinase